MSCFPLRVFQIGLWRGPSPFCLGTNMLREIRRSEQERFYTSRAFERFCRDLELDTWSVGPTFGDRSEDLVRLFSACQDEYSTNFSWACILTRYMDASYFDSVRVVENRGGFLGRSHTRTNTRVLRGSVALRYHDSVSLCSDLVAAA